MTKITPPSGPSALLCLLRAWALAWRDVVSGDIPRRATQGGAPPLAGLAALIAVAALFVCMDFDSEGGGNREEVAGLGTAVGESERRTNDGASPPAVRVLGSGSGPGGLERRTAAAHQWGLQHVPLLPPSKPARAKKPASGKGAPLPVLKRVPTTDKVVFLTIDDGAEKDPEFLEMVRDLSIPVTVFLSDYVARDNYGYFRELRRLGNPIENHTVNHPQLPSLEPPEQREEICRQQDILRREIKVAPRLFRPPYGEFDNTTLKTAQSCGAKVALLWTVEAFPDHLEYASSDITLHPGDIILTHFRGNGQWNGTMTDMLRKVLQEVTSKGLALGRLENYV